MPLYTPTAPRVKTNGDRTPPMFRPDQQARLVPTEASNPSPTQSFLPGLGQVQSGNQVSTGLDPEGEEVLSQREKQAARAQRASAQQLKDKVQWLEQKVAQVDARIDQAKATGLPLPRQRIRRLRTAQQKAREMISYLRKHISQVQGGGTILPPWKRRPRYSQPVLRSRPIQPLQANRERHLSATETTPAQGVEGLTDWMVDTTAGVPNWAFLAGGGGLLAVAALKMRKKKRSR